MSLQDLQKQALELSVSDRWQLVQTLLDSLKHETQQRTKRGNLLRLRGIAKSTADNSEINSKDAYTNYLAEKYQ